jgi:hypothetical protein
MFNTTHRNNFADESCSMSIQFTSSTTYCLTASIEKGATAVHKCVLASKLADMCLQSRLQRTVLAS